MAENIFDLIATLSIDYNSKGTDQAKKDLEEVQKKADLASNKKITIVTETKGIEESQKALNSLTLTTNNAYKDVSRATNEINLSHQKEIDKLVKLAEQEQKEYELRKDLAEKSIKLESDRVAKLNQIQNSIKNQKQPNNLETNDNQESDGGKKKIKVILGEINELYKDHNSKLAQQDQRFNSFRQTYLATDLNVSEKKIFDSYNRILQTKEGLDKSLSTNKISNSGLGTQLIEGIKGQTEKVLGVQEGFLTKLGSSAIGTIGIYGSIASAVGAVGLNLAELGAADELLQNKFLAFTGNVETAKELVDVVGELAIKTGIAGNEIGDIAQKSLLLGNSVTQTKQLIESFAVASKATGESITTIADSIQKVQAKGFASKLDLTSIQNQGIPIVQELSKNLGISEQKVRSIKKIAATDLVKAFESATAKGSGLATIADLATKSFTGLKNKNKEIVSEIKEDIGEAFLPFGKKVFDIYNGFLEKIRPGIKSLSAVFGGIFDVAISSAATLFGVIQDIGVALLNIVTVGNTYAIGKLFTTENITTFFKAVKTIPDVLSAIFTNMKVDIYTTFDQIFIKTLEFGKKLSDSGFGKYFGLEGVTKKFDAGINNLNKEIDKLKDKKVNIKILISNADAPDADIENLVKPKNFDYTGVQKVQKDDLAKLQKGFENFKNELRKTADEINLEGVIDFSKIVNEVDAIKAQQIIIDKYNKIQDKIKELKKVLPKNDVSFEADLFFITDAFNSTLSKIPNIVVPFEPLTKFRERFKGYSKDLKDQLEDILTESFKGLGKQDKKLAFDLVSDLGLTITVDKNGKIQSNIDLFNADLAERLKTGLEKAKEIIDGKADKFNNNKLTRTLVNLFGTKGLIDKTQEDALRDSFNVASVGVQNLTDQLIQAEIDKTDFLISETEKRVDKLKEIAENGNSEQLQIEEDRLNNLLNARDKAAQRQRQIAAIEVAASNAVSAAKAIQGLTAAFLSGGPAGIITGIAYSVALASTIAATIAGLGNAFNSIKGFKTGTESLEGPGDGKSDSIIIKASRGERIVPEEQNRQIPKEVKNKDLPKLVEQGLRFKEIIKEERARMTEFKVVHLFKSDEVRSNNIVNNTNSENNTNLVNRTRLTDSHYTNYNVELEKSLLSRVNDTFLKVNVNTEKDNKEIIKELKVISQRIANIEVNVNFDEESMNIKQRRIEMDNNRIKGML